MDGGAPRGLQADACGRLKSCSACSASWPDCAWCGSTASCREAGADLRAYVAAHLVGYHVLGLEEARASYGQNWPGMPHSTCGAWLINPASCMALESWCISVGADNCMSCTSSNLCGYCQSAQGSRCLAGTRSGEIGMSSEREVCGIEDGGAPAGGAQREWMFRNWTTTSTMDAPCVASCSPQEEVLEASSGEIRHGAPEEGVTFAARQECGWRIQPARWPAGWTLQVTLRFDGAANAGDRLEVQHLRDNASSRADELIVFASVGCVQVEGDGREASCEAVRDALYASALPVQISFTSGARGVGQEATGAWRVHWELVGSTTTTSSRTTSTSPAAGTTTSTRTYMAGVLPTPYLGSDFIIWVGVVTMALPLLGIFLLLLWRWYRNPIRRQQRAQDAHGGAGRARHAPRAVDIAKLEQELPSCRPRVIGAPLANDDSGGGDPANGSVCSVCLANLEEGEEARQLPCRHNFHVECIDGWLFQHMACPVCRQQLPASVAPVAAEPRGADEQSPVGHSEGELTQGAVPPGATIEAVV